MSKMLITGATGQLGGAVTNFLYQKGLAAETVALARDPQKAAPIREKGIEVRPGDYDDIGSLAEAFKGIEKLYFVSGNDIGKRIQQHDNVIDAAEEAGVQHVFYTSFQRKNDTESSPIYPVAKSHLHTEKRLKESGLSYTILKHNLYTDYLPVFMGEHVIESGVIEFPAGEGKAAFTTRRDMAEAGANLLAGSGHENKVYEISHNESVSFRDIAGYLSEITGKEIRYDSPVPEEYKAGLIRAGVPEIYAEMNKGFATGIKENEFDFPETTLESILGRKPVSVGEYLGKMYGK